MLDGAKLIGAGCATIGGGRKAAIVIPTKKDVRDTLDKGIRLIGHKGNLG
jgi:hypothetical protein